MKAVAITPKEKNSAKLVEMDKPKVSDIEGGRGMRRIRAR